MERDGLQQFMAASAHPILTRDEELALARRKDTDKQAFDTLVTHNVRLVYSIARRYANQGVPLDDLIQEGTLGLIRAVEKFDPERGFKLSTYATWWIRQQIDKCINEKDRTIKLPRQVATDIARVRRATRKLRQSGIEPSPEQIGAKLEPPLTGERVKQLLHLARSVLSLDAAAPTADGDMPTDRLADPYVQIEDDVVAATEADGLRTAIAKLPERLQRILELRYGLDGGGERTLEEVGRELGITRERVRQLQTRALKEMRQWVRAA